MKSSYELAMERLAKAAPAVNLSAAQKAKIAELESVYAAKIAEREIFLKGEIAKANETGDFEALEQLKKEVAFERRKFESELEEKKEKARKA